VKIDPRTGLLATPGQSDSIFEYFREEFVPSHGADEQHPLPGNRGTDDLLRDIF